SPSADGAWERGPARGRRRCSRPRRWPEGWNESSRKRWSGAGITAELLRVGRKTTAVNVVVAAGAGVMPGPGYPMRSASRLRESWRLLESLFSPDVVVEASGDDAPSEPLHPLEANFVRDAVPRRRREFAMGRACARRALARLGIEDRPLLPGHDRAPLWP